jgi:hypothetical protein
MAEITMAETTMDEMVLWTKRPVPSATGASKPMDQKSYIYILL